MDIFPPHRNSHLSGYSPVRTSLRCQLEFAGFYFPQMKIDGQTTLPNPIDPNAFTQNVGISPFSVRFETQVRSYRM
jgi:hypothetical protein